MEDALGPVGVPLSVGLLLPVLISADVAATGVYRRHADWKYIIRLLPCFLIGTMLGWWVFDYFQGGDHRVRQLKVLIGLILLSMTALHFILQARKRKKHVKPRLWMSHPRRTPQRINRTWHCVWLDRRGGHHACQCRRPYCPALPSGDGAAQICIYWDICLALFDRKCMQDPFMIDLGIITWESIAVSGWLFVPAMSGAVLAPMIVKRINQKIFESMIWFFIILAGLRMIF